MKEAKKETEKTVSNKGNVMEQPVNNSITQQLKEVSEKNSKARIAEDKRLYKRFTSQIDKAYQNMENSYLQTAFALHAIYKNKLYYIDNFKNIYDFAKQKYSISRGTCNNFINICEKFGVLNENGNIMELSPEYSQYSVSQLAVMLAFPKELLLQCKSDLSVRELKRMKTEYEERVLIEENSNKASEKKGKKDDAETELDIDESLHDVFVCQASDVNELISLKDIIADTLHDIVNNSKICKGNARLEVRIVF